MLLQEIINIYPAINPATLTAHQSNRVCNALALLQCVASHPETRYDRSPDDFIIFGSNLILLAGRLFCRLTFLYFCTLSSTL